MRVESEQVEVHLYGLLRLRADQNAPGAESVMRIRPEAGETVRGALDRLGISEEEFSNVFYNGRLSGGEDMLKPGDRIGVFPFNMSLLYC